MSFLISLLLLNVFLVGGSSQGIKEQLKASRSERNKTIFLCNNMSVCVENPKGCVKKKTKTPK